MKLIRGDIWELYDFGYPIVIPVNVGWTKEGHSVMGRGVAADCAKRMPDSKARWGALCMEYKERVTTCYDDKLNLFYFPTKPLNVEAPHLSWQGKATVDTVKRSLAGLIVAAKEAKIENIVIPLVGCGNGGLAPKVIRKLMLANLDDRFTLIEP